MKVDSIEIASRLESIAATIDIIRGSVTDGELKWSDQVIGDALNGCARSVEDVLRLFEELMEIIAQ